MKKLWWLSVFVCFASLAYAVDFPPDSDRVIHVSKSGNDGNAGHAQQYPIAFGADAKLTIAGAIAVAQNGDTIIIWPGTYAESVDLDTANLSVDLVGTQRDQCIINPAAAHAIMLESGCTVRNLTAIAGLGGSYRGITLSGKHNILIEQVHVEAMAAGVGHAPDALYAAAAYNFTARNSSFKCSYDAVQIALAYNYLIEDCVIWGTGEITDETPCGIAGYAGFSTGQSRGIIRNCDIYMKVTVNNDNAVCGVDGGRGMILDNVNIYVEASSDADGDVYGVWSRDYASGHGLISIKGGLIQTSGQVNEYDIYVDGSSEVLVNSVLCDSAKINGSPVQVATGWAAAVNAEVDRALDTAIPGVPTVDSINEFIKAMGIKLPTNPYLLGSDVVDGLDNNLKGDIEQECKDAVVAYNLDHVAGAVAGAGEIHDDSALAKMANQVSWVNFNRASQSLTQIRLKQESVQLASDGLDSVSTAEPAGVASDFREMMVQVWRRFFKQRTTTKSIFKTYKDDDSVATTQSVSFDGVTKTMGDAE